jgi:hypothetical protein
VGDRTVAVVSLSLAWGDLTGDQKATLAQLRDLFRSGKDGRGAGDLNRLKPRPGVIGIADDLLPRYGRTKVLGEAPVMQRLQNYWTNDARTELVALAHLTPLERFLKLTTDENCSRLLESLWRSARADFKFKDGVQALEATIRMIEGDLLPTLDLARKVEDRAKTVASVTGIEFEEDEVVVKASGGFRQLVQMLHSTEATSSPYRAVLELYGSSIDVAKSIKSLRAKCETAERAMERLQRCADDLLQNYREHGRAVTYLSLTEESLRATVESEMNVGQTCTPVSLSQEVTARAERLEDISGALARLQKQLDNLAGALGSDQTEEDMT